MEPKQNIIPCNHFELLNDVLSREIKNGYGGRVIEGWVGSALVFMVFTGLSNFRRHFHPKMGCDRHLWYIIIVIDFYIAKTSKWSLNLAQWSAVIFINETQVDQSGYAHIWPLGCISYVLGRNRGEKILR
jgi:hypothetical protein